MKKIMVLIMTIVMSFGMVISVNASNKENTLELAEKTTDDNEITNRAISISKDFSCATGKSWSTTFTVNKLFAEDHNAFKVVISNLKSGKYKIIIEGSDGYSYTSSEHSTDRTITVTNAKSGDVSYTVYIVNVGSGELAGHVKISSYYAN